MWKSARGQCTRKPFSAYSAPSLSRRIRAAESSARRRPLRRKSQSPVQAFTISSHPQTLARGRPGPLPQEPWRHRNPSQGTRHSLEEDNWESPTLGAWGMGGKCFLTALKSPSLPTSSKAAGSTSTHFRRTHLRPRAHLRLPPGCRERLRSALVRGQNLRRHSPHGRAAALRVQL